LQINGISHDNIWLSQQGSDLEITLAGTDDKVTIRRWYDDADKYEVEQIEVGGSVLLNTQVDQLVSAMASYNVPSGAGNVIPQDTKDALQSVVAASWS